MLLALLLWSFISAPQPSIKLSITPQVCLEYCAVVASITIADYEREREVCFGIRVLGADFNEQESCWPYSGYTVTRVGLKHIAAGEYEIFASLSKAGGLRATQTLMVGGGDKQ